MMVNALAIMIMVTGKVMPPCVMVRRGWLGEEVGDTTSSSLYAATRSARWPGPTVWEVRGIGPHISYSWPT